MADAKPDEEEAAEVRHPEAAAEVRHPDAVSSNDEAEHNKDASSGIGEDEDVDDEDDEPRWWKACERCGQDRKLWVHPYGYWYCEMNPDPDAPRCEPTANCPLRVKGGSAGRTSTGLSDLSDEHVQEMLSTFSKLKQAGTDQEYVLASGWKASFRKRKRGDGGDAYITKEGEQALRSVADVRRRFGLPMG